eukprot:10235098-Alexandrium_andersonii.AAC.1
MGSRVPEGAADKHRRPRPAATPMRILGGAHRNTRSSHDHVSKAGTTAPWLGEDREVALGTRKTDPRSRREFSHTSSVANDE